MLKFGICKKSPYLSIAIKKVVKAYPATQMSETAKSFKPFLSETTKSCASASEISLVHPPETEIGNVASVMLKSQASAIKRWAIFILLWTFGLQQLHLWKNLCHTQSNVNLAILHFHLHLSSMHS